MNQPVSTGKKIDWKWVGVGYCFFVVFHLLPTYLLLEFSFVGKVGDILRSLWLLVGLLVIGVYIGFRSRGYTVIEPAISAVLYVATIFFKADDFMGRGWSSRSYAGLLVASLIAFALAMIGASLGEMLQATKERKPPQQ